MNDRREFIKTSATFMAVLGAFNLVGAGVSLAEVRPGTQGLAKVRADSRTLKLVLNDALASGDMTATLRRFKGQLSPQQEMALAKLTAEDLRSLNNIKNKIPSDLAEGHEGAIIF